MNVKETLEAARKVFVERGGAVGVLMDDQGRVCALGALRIACGTDLNSTPDARLSRYWEPREVLGKAANDLYGSIVVTVNDEIGRDAVLACYDRAIEAAS